MVIEAVLKVITKMTTEDVSVKVIEDHSTGSALGITATGAALNSTIANSLGNSSSADLSFGEISSTSVVAHCDSARSMTSFQSSSSNLEMTPDRVSSPAEEAVDFFEDSSLDDSLSTTKSARSVKVHRRDTIVKFKKDSDSVKLAKRKTKFNLESADGENEEETFSPPPSPTSPQVSSTGGEGMPESRTLSLSTISRILTKMLKRNWIPSTKDEVAVVPRDCVAHYEVHETVTAPQFSIMSQKNEVKTQDNTDKYYHLMFLRGGELFSVYRNETLVEVQNVHQLCSNKLLLFSIFEGELSKCREAFDNLIKYIIQNPFHDAIHIAISLNRVDFFSSESQAAMEKAGTSLDMHVNRFCIGAEMYPIHLALYHEKHELVELLAKNGAELMKLDGKGNNIYHVATRGSSKTIEFLFNNYQETRFLINELNDDMRTPLMVAVRTAKAFLIPIFLNLQGKCEGLPSRSTFFEAALQNNNASVINMLYNEMPEKKAVVDYFGFTPIHLSTGKECTLAFASLPELAGVDVNATSKFGQTPLYQCVDKKNAISIAIALIAHGAEVNIAEENGNSPLHRAVAYENPMLVRLFLCVGANPNAKNFAGETPRHFAARRKNMEMLKVLCIAGAKRCEASKGDCVSDCIFVHSGIASVIEEDPTLLVEDNEKKLRKEDYMETGFTRYEKNVFDEVIQKKAKKNKVNVLSLDGGGIRGLAICQVLLEMEKILDKPICEYFDWIVGTSTGGLIAASLVQKKNLYEIQREYLKLKDKIFDGATPPYDTNLLEKFIKVNFGEESISAIGWPKLMISAVDASRFPVQLKFFRNYAINNKIADDVPLWKALRRTTCAPFFFNPMDHFIDGGLIANNPTLDVLQEVQTMAIENPDEEFEVNSVVSLGTGQIPTIPLENLAVEAARPIQSAVTVKNLSMILVDQCTAAEGAPVERSRAWCAGMKWPYFRLSPPLSNQTLLSATNDLEIVALMWDSFKFTKRNQEYIQSLCKLLSKQ